MTLLKTLHRIVFSFALLFFSLASYTFSQELSDTAGTGLETTASIEDELKWLQAETFVWGASKYEQKVSEAPSSVTIITADEIKKFGFRTLAEMLRSIRGFFVSYERNWNHLGTRGFNLPGDFNSRILLLIDGHGVNDSIYGAANIGSASILNIDNIDRVEVIRGSSSSLYGTSAFLGVINVITKSWEDLKGVEVAGEYGR
tara:strand:- start:4096 stop:4698 length:603 start_codon:yes stop_codon:yes gene_type:complete